ncbi:MAG: thermonuclease family protein [Nitrospira sp.]|nr:thermonuclease family protein [Nitrospira sp.]
MDDRGGAVAMKPMLQLALYIVVMISACAHRQPLHSSTLQLARESPFIDIIVHHCYDGDTCTVTLSDPSLPPVLGDHIPVRLAGIDTPEIKGHCDAERTMAIQARDFLTARLAAASRVDLAEPKRDKYFRLNGRLLADGQDLSQALIAAQLARHYDGGTKQPFC